jgi:membrane protease YdiL (CAAX protease family)
MLAVLRDRTVTSLVLLLSLLVVCNFGFAFSDGWSRWGWQAFAFVGLFFVYRYAKLSLADIGLSRARVGQGLKYGLITIAVILLALIIAYLIKQNIFRDSRYHHSLSSAIGAGLFILPLKIVLFEEVAFRGIMPALLKNLGSKTWVVFVVTSGLFALWHILTAPKSSNVSVGHYSNLLILGAVFVTTFLGGIIFYYLRYKSDSLVAPIMVHWLINGSAIVLAALSWRTH